VSGSNELSKLAAAAIAGGHRVTRVAQGKGHNIGNKTWEKITQHGPKVNPNIVSPVSHSREPQHSNAYEKKTPENQVPVRDVKTGPKGGGKVKTVVGHGRWTGAAINTGTTHAAPQNRGNKFEKDAHFHGTDTSPVVDKEKHVQGSYTRKPPPPTPEGKNPKRVSWVHFNKFKGRDEGVEMGDGLIEKYEGFKKLEGELAKKKGVKDPKALAAAIGRKKYGSKGFSTHKHGHAEGVEFSDDEARRLAEIAAEFDLDEAKRRAAGKRVPMAPTPVSSPLKGQSQDQSGIGVSHDNANYSISDQVEPNGELVEISKEKLASYTRVAARDQADSASRRSHSVRDSIDAEDRGRMDKSSEHMVKAEKLKSREMKRDRGIFRALNKLAGNAKVPATEEVNEIVGIEHVKPIQMPSPTVISSKNGPKNSSSLQKTATKRDNAQQANEEIDPMDVLLKAIDGLREKEVKPVHAGDNQRDTLIQMWSARTRRTD
jgi:hypothetical protein